MKKFPQCMMCTHAMGRRCTLRGETIPEEIYSNTVVCKDFSDLSGASCDADDACCSESLRYEQEMKKYES